MFEIKSEPVSFLVYLKPQCIVGAAVFANLVETYRLTTYIAKPSSYFTFTRIHASKIFKAAEYFLAAYI